MSGFICETIFIILFACLPSTHHHTVYYPHIFFHSLRSKNLVSQNPDFSAGIRAATFKT